jgi:hypothetical protein
MRGQKRPPETARGRLRLLASAVAAVVAMLLVWGFYTGRNEAVIEVERDQPVKVPLRVSIKNGEPTLTIDAATQQRSGIETAVLPAAPYQMKIRAYGVVLDVARLTELSNSYANAKAQVQTALAKLAMSQPAFERAQSLYKHRAVSEAQMQSAEAEMRTDQATLAAAQAQVRALTATAYQEWGAVLGQSLVDQSPAITRLIERQDFLLQITLMPGTSLPDPPTTAAIETGKKTRTSITFVSPATHIDPKIQGFSFFYTVPATSGVLPGMNVLAFLPTGVSVSGVVAPPAAIVWWQDRAWVYRRTAPDMFVRTEIGTELPGPDGGYIVKDIPKDTQIVTRGAQLLLSEEFRSQIRVDEDSQ